MSVILKEAGGSLDDHIERIRMAWRAYRDSQETGFSYVVDVFTDHAVVKFGEWGTLDPKSYRVNYTANDQGVTFAPMNEWVQVQLNYVPVAVDETSVSESLRGLVEAVSGKDPEAVIVIEGLSANSNEYTRAALESGIAIFSGAPMYADHPSTLEESTRPERSVRDLVGRVGQAYLGTDKNGKVALRAPITISESESWLKTKIKEGIANQLSIRASGKGKKGADGRFIVESFVGSPHTSVDFVTVASAGGYAELKESQRAEAPEKQLEESDDTLIVVLKESGMKPEELKALQESNQKLLEENQRLFRQIRTQEAEVAFNGLLVEALPAATKDKLREQAKSLIEAYATHGSEQTLEQVTESLGKLVDAEKAYLAKLMPNGVVSGLSEAAAPVVEADLEEAFSSLLGSKDAAKIAAQGRR